MKKYYLLLCITLCVYASSFAQDVIVKKDGSIVKAKVTEVGEKEVKYKKFDSTSERIYIISTENILSINYEDGEIEKFSVQLDTCKVNQKEHSQNSHTDTEANSIHISKVNSATLSFEKSPSKRRAKIGVVQMAATPRSELTNEDVSFSFETGAFSKNGDTYKYSSYADRTAKDGTVYNSRDYPGIRICVTNRTTHTLYLDLGNTFIVIGEKTYPYYVPGSTATEKTESGGVGLNLGAVAGALGVEGTLGTLAGGLTVGGGTGTSVTQVSYNQRVVGVAPMSKIFLEPQKLIDEKFVSTVNTWASQINLNREIQQGETYTFNESTSPYTIKFFLGYSSTEDCSQINTLDFSLYAQTIYGIPGDSSAYGFALAKIKRVTISPDMIYMYGHLK